MAYHFLAEKQGPYNQLVLSDHLRQFALVEFFPIEFGEGLTMFGISVPFKNVKDGDFASQLVEVMSYLIIRHVFSVTDLFTGRLLRAEDISDLPRIVSA